MRKIITIFLVMTMLLSFPVYGSKIDSKKEELGNVKDSLEESKKELEEKSKARAGAQDQIRSLDEVIIAVESQLLQLNKNLEVKEEELDDSTDDLLVVQRAKDKQYEDGKARIQLMYKNQKVGYLQIIFTSKNFWEILNRVEYIRKIAQYDQTMLDNMKVKQDEVAVRTDQLESEAQEISLLYKEQIGIKSRLDITRDEKDKTLVRLEKDEDSLKTQIEDMVKISDDLEKEVQRLIKQSQLTFSGGKFLWPVPGNNRISSDYNPRTHPISGVYKFHTGIDIPAAFGRSVVAAESGKVIKAGWQGGYGNTIMIDHGSGLVTLYGHNSSLTVAVGDMVQRGAQVARIGSTGYSTGNHSHFEVRLNGVHKNPHNYLK